MFLHEYGMNFESWMFSIRSAVENSINTCICKGSGSLRPLTAETCFRPQASQCEFCGGKCGKERSFFSKYFLFSLTFVIPPIKLTHLYLSTTVIRRTRLGTLEQNNALSEIGELWAERHLYVFTSL